MTGAENLMMRSSAAAEFIDGHASRPLTLAGIAAQAGVTPRALQYAFRREYDTALMSYLRQVPLERAHQDLLAAAYLAVYGRPPSHTLRR